MAFAVSIADDFIDNIDEHIADVLDGEFQDLDDGTQVFKGIQLRDNDIVARKLTFQFPGYKIVYNFVRRSPEGQEEPNWIHEDSLMGDYMALLYLNETHPEEAGTSIYTEGEDEPEKAIEVRMKKNRLVAFPCDLLHSRNIFENFGFGDDARLVQVVFLKGEA